MIGRSESVELAKKEFPDSEESRIIGLKGETPSFYVMERVSKNDLDLPVICVHKRSGAVVVVYLPRDFHLLDGFEPSSTGV